MRRSGIGTRGIALLAALGIASIADLVLSQSLLAQETPSRATSASLSRAQAMEPLAWLVGDWEGEGWIQRGPEQRFEFTQTEHVEAAFDGRLLLVEGIGRVKVPGGGEGPIAHHAYGVLSWNPEKKGYRFDTYLADDAGVDAEASLENGVVTWGFDTPGGQIRFHIRQTEADEWHETGEMSPDGGTTWYPFFEMKLRRQASGAGSTAVPRPDIQGSR